MLASEYDDPKMCNVFTQIQDNMKMQVNLARVDNEEEAKQQQQN